MGWPWIDALYCPNSNPEWPSGKTPMRIYATFSGIERGPLWFEGLPDIASKTLELIQINETHWEGGDDDDFWGIFVCDRYGTSSLLLDYIGYLPFNHDSWLLPFFAAENDQQSPGSYYYIGGCGMVTWYEFFGPASAGKIELDVIGENAVDIKGEFFNVDGIKSVYRFARVSDHTCVRILVDKTYIPP
jgi:hypothetical protein